MTIRIVFKSCKILFFLYFCLIQAFQEASAKNDWEPSGWLIIQGAGHDKGGGQGALKGKWELQQKRDDRGFKAVVSIKARSDSEDVRLDQAYIDWKDSSDHNIEVGYRQREFGLESELGLKKRIRIRRSLLGRKIETFDFVGSAMEGRTKLKPIDRLQLEGMVGHNQSLDKYALLRLTWIQSGSHGLTILYQRDRIDAQSQNVGGASIHSHGSSEKGTLWECEILAAIDPEASSFHRLYGNRRSVWFGGARAGIAFPAFEAWGNPQPYLIATGLSEDLEQHRQRQWELALGVKSQVEESLQLGIGMETLWRNSPMDWDHYQQDVGATGEISYVF